MSNVYPGFLPCGPGCNHAPAPRILLSQNLLNRVSIAWRQILSFPVCHPPGGNCSSRFLPYSRARDCWRPTAETKFSTDVKVVNVLVTVRDKQGKIVRNLTKDDFT